VARICLIGSIVTTKNNPNCVDLLITVSDEVSLEQLATASRSLMGRVGGFNRGAEIFLCRPNGEYLGRICPWKKCQPGVRMACKADSCGHRQYLYDDLSVATLDAELIREPPLTLWPEPDAKIKVPMDLFEHLVDPFING